MDAILGKDTRMVQPPLSMSRSEKPPLYHKTRSVDTHDRRPLEQVLVAEGVHRDIDLDSHSGALPARQDAAVAFTSEPWVQRSSAHKVDGEDAPNPLHLKRDLHAKPQEHRPTHAATAPMSIDHHGKGQAHDPLTDHLFLNLGAGSSSRPPSPPTISESPPAADVDIYETAYHNEIERIRANQGRSATLFLTRRVDEIEDYRKDEG